MPPCNQSPLELVAIDFVHLEKGSSGYKYILVIVDHFTCYAQAYATMKKSAKTAAEKLYNHFIQWFGFPTKIHHDQGGEFENRLFARLQQLCDIKHSRTTPYHPQGNGQVECFNCTLLPMLCTMPEAYKSNWKDHLNKVVHAHNCTHNDSTGYSPFFLPFGCHPHLPINLVFNIDPSSPHQSYPQYVSAWKSAMEEAYSLAAKKSQNSGEKAKHYYDRKIRSTLLQPDDRVFVRNLSERGGPDSPVYEVNQKMERDLLEHYIGIYSCHVASYQLSLYQKKSSPSRPVQSRRKPTRRELPPRFTRPAKSETCLSKEDCSSDEDGDIIFVSRPQSH